MSTRHYSFEISDLMDAMERCVQLLYNHDDVRVRWAVKLISAWKVILARIYHARMTPEDNFNIILMEIDEVKARLDANAAEHGKLKQQFDAVLQRQAHWMKENA